MKFLKKLSSLFSTQAPYDNSYYVTVTCNRCGETIQARINLANDLSSSYADGATTYYCRKVLMGTQKCFQKIEVELTFDINRKVTDRKIVGGKFTD